MTRLAVAAPVLGATDLLAGLLAIPSVTGSEGPASEALAARLREAGFDAHVDAAGSCVARWGNGPVDVMLVGHIDTVAGDVPVRREGDLLYGRGAVDAKGPLAAALAAVSRQQTGGRHTFTVVAAVDEEGSSRGARALLGRAAPDHLIILEPSGWDAVTIGYRGCLRVRLRVVQGVQHGAAGSPSAPDRVVRVVEALRAHAAAQSDGGRAFDQIDVRLGAIVSGGDGLEEWCDAAVAVRVPLAVTTDAVVMALQGLCDAHGAGLAVEWACEAVRRPRSTPLASAFVRAIRRKHAAPRFKVKTGTADMNLLVPAWGCPAVAYGPGDSHLDHTPFECIDVRELERGADVLAAVLSEL